MSYRGAASSSPDTSCEEADASTVTAPPASDPVPCTVNGMAPRPPSSMTAPISRSAAMIAPTGRCEARGSPWNSVATLASAATGGTNRITVPAFPTSTRASLAAQPGETRQAVVPASAGLPGSAEPPGPRNRRPEPPVTAARLPVTPELPVTTVAPSARRAPAISSVSRASSGLRMSVGPAARAARTRARLVMDFDPGTRSRARSGPPACGAGQGRAARPGSWRGMSML